MARHGATRRDTGRKVNPEPGPMSAKTTGRKKAASTSRGTRKPTPTTGAKKPSRPTSRPTKKTPSAAKAKKPAAHTGAANRKGTRPTPRKTNPAATAAQIKLVDRASRATEKAHQVVGLKPQLFAHLAAVKAHGAALKAFADSPEAKRYHAGWITTHKAEAARLKGAAKTAHRLNPSTPADLAKVWKAWTGAEPTKVMELEVEDAKRFGLPSKVVLLGRVSWFATKDGQEERFGDAGPLMVTDAAAKRVWLVSSKRMAFDMQPALIGYLARKPKFGDQGLVEYVHAFEGRTRAVMDGHGGALTGTFRITPAGLEG